MKEELEIKVMRYLDGELSDHERKEFEIFIKENKEAKDLLDNLNEVNVQLKNEHRSSEVISAEERLSEFSKDLIKKETETETENIKTRKFKVGRMRSVFFVSLFLSLGLQLYGGGIPANQDLYFYIGYLASPIFISTFITLFAYILFRKYLSPKQEVSLTFRNINFKLVLDVSPKSSKAGK